MHHVDHCKWQQGPVLSRSCVKNESLRGTFYSRVWDTQGRARASQEDKVSGAPGLPLQTCRECSGGVTCRAQEDGDRTLSSGRGSRMCLWHPPPARENLAGPSWLQTHLSLPPRPPFVPLGRNAWGWGLTLFCSSSRTVPRGSQCPDPPIERCQGRSEVKTGGARGLPLPPHVPEMALRGDMGRVPLHLTTGASCSLCTWGAPGPPAQGQKPGRLG